MGKYLDKTGLQYFYGKLKEKFADKTTIENKLDSLTGALTWKGKFDTLPAVTDYKAGNVVGVGNKEYVLTVTGSTKAWEELGDEGSYLLKSVAEETYLKKADGAVTTANIADGAVVSTKLATGARKPIILTPETTEVDEETYQKLLPDGLPTSDVDIMFRIGEYDTGEFIPCISSTIHDAEGYMELYFAGISYRGTLQGAFLIGYYVTIGTGTPHQCEVTKLQYKSLNDILSDAGYLNKSTLNPVLKEIDLTGTDADRKAKLDQFETDWKALTGANDLLGARFVGKVSISVSESSYITYGIFTRNNYGKYVGICQVGNSLGDDEFIPYTVWLEYDEMGCHVHADKLGTITEVMMNGVSKGTIGIVDLGTVITAHQDISGKVDKTLNAKAFEGITIKTSKTTEAANANKAAIQAYVDNLKALGVDTTKEFNVPVRIDGNFYGCLTGKYFGEANYFLSGTVFSVGGANYIKDIYINPSGRYSELVNIMNDNDLSTTSKDLIGAINEVNTLAKNKQDKLTSGTNIKTINNQSLLGSGNIEISAPSITVDTTMSDTSTNPVQNKVIKAYIDGLVGNVAAWIEYE